MTLDSFHDIAEEQTQTMVMTPELRNRILSSLDKKPKRRHTNALKVAAACLIVMAFSAGALALGDQTPTQAPQSKGNAISLSSLPNEKYDPPVLVGTYSLGFAPAQGEDGLWGYVDQENNWAIKPVYKMVYPIESSYARVITEQGEEELLLLPEKVGKNFIFLAA